MGPSQMQIAKELIISLLKVSKSKPVSLELVKKEARLPSQVVEKLLQKLQYDGLLYVHDGLVEINVLQRLKLAIRALALGADYERVSGFLGWKEFESVAAVALEAHGYSVKTNLRFRQGGRRWEIDVVGCRKPLVVCVDCKHWFRRLYPSKLKRAVEGQVRRTLAFSEVLPNPAVRVDCASWNDARFVPVVLSLTPTSFKFHNGTPIVAIVQLRDFLAQLPICVNSLKYFDKAHFKTVS
jgi:Holliday junction resolvase-like predicted endonuclease